jgi:urease accessory protein
LFILNEPNEDDKWLLWQLADSAFPTGGFAHSGGLEAAWQGGEIGDTAQLSSYLEASLGQLASSMIPFVIAARQKPEALQSLDKDCDAFLSNHVANRASRLQGRALANSAERIFGPALKLATECYHLAPIFGAAARVLKISRSMTAELFLFQSLRSWLAAAVRLGIVGPMEAQTLQHCLAPTARRILRDSIDRDISEIANTSPLQEIWQGSHDRLYSRLFQS